MLFMYINGQLLNVFSSAGYKQLNLFLCPRMDWEKTNIYIRVVYIYGAVSRQNSFGKVVFRGGSSWTPLPLTEVKMVGSKWQQAVVKSS